MKRVAALAGSLVALAASTLFAERSAHAYEHQYHLGGAFGYTGLIADKGGASGFATRIHLDYGLNDAINLMSKIEVADFPGPSVIVPSAAVGVNYVVDVLQWVPYLGAMAGVADVWITPACGAASKANGATCHQPKLDLEIPVGLDYMISRRFAVGVLGRYQLLVADGPTYNFISVFLKAEYIWGF